MNGLMSIPALGHSVHLRVNPYAWSFRSFVFGIPGMYTPLYASPPLYVCGGAVCCSHARQLVGSLFGQEKADEIAKGLLFM